MSEITNKAVAITSTVHLECMKELMDSHVYNLLTSVFRRVSIL